MFIYCEKLTLTLQVFLNSLAVGKLAKPVTWLAPQLTCVTPKNLNITRQISLLASYAHSLQLTPMGSDIAKLGLLG